MSVCVVVKGEKENEMEKRNQGKEFSVLEDKYGKIIFKNISGKWKNEQKIQNCRTTEKKN